MTAVFLSTYAAAGYPLKAAYDTLFITATGGAGGTGITGNTLVDTISNGGVINGSGPPGTFGVQLMVGGYVSNGPSASIRGASGIYIGGGAGTVTNDGAITGVVGYGVVLGAGGAITNGSATNGGSIGGAYSGVYLAAGGTVTNFGGIQGTTKSGVNLGTGGGTVKNGTTEDTAASIGGATHGLYSTGLATISNYATVQGAKDGVYLKGGGTVTNGGYTDTKALIEGRKFGLYATGLAATVTNFGTIEETGSSFLYIGAYLKHGGVITNGGLTDHAALITGYRGVVEAVAGSTLTNFGTVTGTGIDANGVYLTGVLTNGSAGDTSASILGGKGAYVGGGSSIVNFGTIEGQHFDGLKASFGGATGVVNGAARDVAATILGATYGVHFDGSGGVTNYGTIDGATKQGVYLGGGTVTNGSRADLTARIDGYGGIGFGSPGTVFNYGTVSAGGGLGNPGVKLALGGSVANGFVSDTVALISGVTGVDIGVAGMVSTAGTVTNFATINGQSGYGVVLRAGGRITNGGGVDRSALIEGFLAIHAGGVATVKNFGTVISTDTSNYGVYLAAGGLLTNGSIANTTALIEGNGGVNLEGAATATNFGTIWGAGDTGGAGLYLGGASLTNGAAGDTKAVIEGYTGVYGQLSGTLTNFGTVIGFGGVAVRFHTNTDALIVEAGSAFVGSVNGGGGTLELAGGTGTLTGLLLGGNVTVSGSMTATTFSNFGTVKIDAGASFALAGGGGTIATGQSLIDAGALSGTGTLALTGGSATFNAGASLNIANVAMAGASTVSVNSNITYAGKWTQSAGTLNVGSGATMSFTGPADSFAGTLSNAGVVGIIGVIATIGAAGLSLTGTGHVLMTDSPMSEITGATAAATLTVGQLLEGDGKLGAGQLTLVTLAGSTIEGAGTNALILDTGAKTIANAGYIESSGAGGVTVVSAIANTGRLIAAAATLTVDGVVTGSGFGEVLKGELKIASTATFNQNVTFSGTGGTLELAHGQTYSGTITGFSKAGNTFLDLDDINAVGAMASWSKATGNLTVTDGTHTATIHLAGDYTGSAFVVANDGHGHALVHDPAKPTAPPSIRPLPLHPFIAAAASFGAPAAAMVATSGDAWRLTPPILASPRVQIA